MATNPPHIFLWHGEDTFSISQRMRLWQQEFIKKYNSDLNISIIDGLTEASEDIISTAETIPFLNPKRLIFIKNLGQEKKTAEKVSEQLKKIPESTIIVCIEEEELGEKSALYKALKEEGKIEYFALPTGKNLIQWIIRECSARNKVIQAKTAEELAAMVGNDLWLLTQELDKLTAYEEGPEITPKAMQKLITPNLTISIFQLTDAIGQKKLQNSMKILQRLTTQNEDLFMVFHMIVRQFRLLLHISELLKNGEKAQNIANTLKEKPFTVMNTMKQCKAFTIEELQAIITVLLEIDVRIKTGKLKTTIGDHRELQCALEQLMIATCLQKEAS